MTTELVRVFQTVSDSGETGENLFDHCMRGLRDVPGREDHEDPYMGLHLGVVRQRLTLWREHLPGVSLAADCSMLTGLSPAVKIIAATPDSFFYALSLNEIRSLRECGVDPAQIIFAQPVKQTKHIVYAQEENIGFLAFDSAFELHKIRSAYKQARLLIRMSVQESETIPKYGRYQSSCQDILNTARMLGLKVDGVIVMLNNVDRSSMHMEADIKDACSSVRSLMEYADKMLNYKMSTVVVKCGVRVGTEEEFTQFTGLINRQLVNSFKKIPARNLKTHPVKLIMDPGEFILSGSVCLAATVIGARRMGSKENKKVSYYVNESVYQSLGALLLLPTTSLTTSVLFYTSKIKSSKGGVQATVYGYTDNDTDTISRVCVLPSDMTNGDVLCIAGLGPYCKAFGRDFVVNPATLYYFCTQDDVGKLQELLPELKLEEEDSFQL